jgi:hypothetical protein
MATQQSTTKRPGRKPFSKTPIWDSMKKPTAVRAISFTTEPTPDDQGLKP